MPFQSEKQRRFMWAEHPEIAKRWAHEYPKSNKNLPMYADKKPDAKEKNAALAALETAITALGNKEKGLTNAVLGRETKVATDGLMYIDIPHSDKPTYAGQEKTEMKEEPCDNKEPGQKAKNTGSDSVESIFGKLAAVLAKPLREMLEAQQALDEARDPRFVPQNMNIKRVSVPSPAIPLPMGMAPPGQGQAPPAPQQQPSNAQQNTAVGGGSNPQHNPIQAFGGLGAKGQLNGNAAFGMKNSPDSLKTAELNPWHKQVQRFVAQGYEPIAAPDGNVTFRKGNKFYSWAHDVPGGKIEEILPEHAQADLEYAGPWNEPELAGAKTAGLFDFLRNKPKEPPVAEAPMSPEELAETAKIFNEMLKRRQQSALVLTPETNKQAGESGAWTRSEGKNPEGGLNAKGRASLKAQGHDIKAPVTESNPKGERAGRQNSFCARMCGMKKHETGAKTKSDPDSRINKSLRKWNCKCASAFEFGEKLADQHGGMFGPAGYMNTLSRWYNPMTTQKVTDPTEKAMMRVGQGALGLGAAAGVGAAGVAAAAPALASTPLSQLPAYVAGTAGAGATAAANPKAQQMFPTFTNAANSAMNTAGNMGTRAYLAGSDMYNNVRETAKHSVPEGVQEAWHTYQHNFGHPYEQTAERMGAGIGGPVNPFTRSGNPIGLVPHNISAPYEFGHQVAHTLGHTLGHTLEDRGGVH